jgi:glycosyltransferase involved in cell wall biosynthesis
MNASPEISIVVCTYNGAAQIISLLDCINQQSEKRRIKVILVDDGSKDETPLLVREWMTKNRELALKFVSSGRNIGLPAARNLGMSMVDTDFVVFTDDDCRPGPTWIADILGNWRDVDRSVVAFTGPVSSYSTDSFNRRYVTETNPVSAAALDQQNKSLFKKVVRYFKKSKLNSGDAVSALVGANMTFRTFALRKVYGFDVAIKFGSDDTIVSYKLRNQFGDESLAYFSNIELKHAFNKKFSDTLRRAYKYAIANAKNQKSNGPTKALPLPTPALSLFLSSFICTPVALSISLTLGLALLLPALLVVIFLLHVNLVRNSAESLLYPYAKWAEELADNIGYLRGLLS